MAMYIFQELAPKVFYFTYCLQETENYIKYLEDTEADNTNKELISLWEKSDEYNQKNLNSNFIDKNVDPRTRYLVNSLHSTFLYCFGQYRIYNNIENLINISNDFYIKKYDCGYPKTLANNDSKYTAYMFLNDDYENGIVTINGYNKQLKVEKGSIIIAPSNQEIILNEANNGFHYVAEGFWL